MVICAMCKHASSLGTTPSSGISHILFNNIHVIEEPMELTSMLQSCKPLHDLAGLGNVDDDDLGFRAPQQGSYMAPMTGKRSFQSLQTVKSYIKKIRDIPLDLDLI